MLCANAASPPPCRRSGGSVSGIRVRMPTTITTPAPVSTQKMPRQPTGSSRAPPSSGATTRATGPTTRWPMPRPAMNVVRVSWTDCVEVPRSSPSAGRPGRYMSIASGAIADSSASASSMGIDIDRVTWNCQRRGRLIYSLARVNLRRMATGRMASEGRTQAELPERLSGHLDAYAEHLRLERDRSEHTVRAYLADARSLLEHL